jgi:hypothetical protein
MTAPQTPRSDADDVEQHACPIGCTGGNWAARSKPPTGIVTWRECEDAGSVLARKLGTTPGGLFV